MQLTCNVLHHLPWMVSTLNAPVMGIAQMRMNSAWIWMTLTIQPWLAFQWMVRFITCKMSPETICLTFRVYFPDPRGLLSPSLLSSKEKHQLEAASLLCLWCATEPDHIMEDLANFLNSTEWDPDNPFCLQLVGSVLMLMSWTLLGRFNPPNCALHVFLFPAVQMYVIRTTGAEAALWTLHTQSPPHRGSYWCSHECCQVCLQCSSCSSYNFLHYSKYSLHFTEIVPRNITSIHVCHLPFWTWCLICWSTWTRMKLRRKPPKTQTMISRKLSRPSSGFYSLSLNLS